MPRLAISFEEQNKKCGLVHLYMYLVQQFPHCTWYVIAWCGTTVYGASKYQVWVLREVCKAIFCRVRTQPYLRCFGIFPGITWTPNVSKVLWGIQARARNLCRFCATSLLVRGTYVCSARMWHNTRRTGTISRVPIPVLWRHVVIKYRGAGTGTGTTPMHLLYGSSVGSVRRNTNIRFFC